MLLESGFREHWPRSTEYINPGSIGIKLPEQTDKGIRPTSFARIDVNQGKVRIIFYGNMLAICLTEFEESEGTDAVSRIQEFERSLL